MDGKAWYLSKTVWFGILTGVAAALMPVFPAFKAAVDGSLPAIAAIWGIVAVILRVITKDKVQLGE